MADRPDPEAEMSALQDMDLTAMSIPEDQVLFPTRFAVYPMMADRKGVSFDAYCLEFHGIDAANNEVHSYVMWPRDRRAALLDAITAEHFPGEPCNHENGHNRD